jgi:heptosyltransferase-2
VLFISEKDREYAKEVLSSHNVSENDLLIGVHPGSSRINVAKRRWAKEGFASVANEVIRKYGAKVIILGGSDEERLAKDITRLMQSEPINVAGKTTLKQLAAIIERCDLFIHNDSAPLYIASAMKTPVVAILGYDNPKVWRPWKGKYIIVRKDLPCSPCLPETRCEKNYECIKSITPEDILQAVENIIEIKY